MTLESGLRDCVLGSSWFIISAFVHHFCKQNGVDARLDSKHSPGQAECWKPRESVKSYRCSKKIHSRKRISLQLPTYEIDLNWLLSDLLIYQSASYILVYEIQNMIYCMYIYIQYRQYLNFSIFAAESPCFISSDRKTRYLMDPDDHLMVHCQKASPGWSNQMHLA